MAKKKGIDHGKKGRSPHRQRLKAKGPETKKQKHTLIKDETLAKISLVSAIVVLVTAVVGLVDAIIELITKLM